MSEMIERVAKAIAIAHGDKWEDVPESQKQWISQRGRFGGRFRGINEYFKDCYLDAARAAIEAMREPTDGMIVAGDDRILKHLNSQEMMSAIPTPSQNCFTAMIDEAMK
jgi:hypothetical protein